MTFWSAQYNPGSEPKRNYRFQITFEGLTGQNGPIVWFAKKVGKPKFTVTEAKHSFMDHHYYFPGRVEWDKISMTLVDPASPNATANILQLIVDSGYKIPASANSQFTSMSKGKAQSAFISNILIQQIDADGKIIEQWTLHNPFITNVGLPELAYDNDDLGEIELELRFDYAVCDVSGGVASNDNSVEFFGPA
tara:strand:- start:110 stop:688 length:579 start_codon:yes stop_codon:yes gene_type:complete